ncbi:hypothetical protein BDQ17DRAFT_1430162 [Cyathus striatus]|nr:hypothetical protein BDQ17DRAFT_1430162 [Cyathus striatus]
MKRGFLNNNNLPNESLAASQPNVTGADTSADATPSEYQDIRIISFKRESQLPLKYVPQTETNPSSSVSTSVICTRIPNSSDSNGFAQCLVTGTLKEKILSDPGFPRAPPCAVNPPVYRISPAGSRGMGMFATHDIEVGDLIIAERPLVVIPGMPTYRIDEITIPPLQGDRAARLALEGSILEFVVRSMDMDNKRAFLGLKNSHPMDPSFLCGILRTNTLLIDLGDVGFGIGREMLYNAVMKTISRVNHSCCPNTVRAFDTKSFSYQLRAARPIAKDEEITISYSEFEISSFHRAAFLKTYGIEHCACTACSSSFSHPGTSDFFRSTMAIRASEIMEEFISLRNRLTSTMRTVIQSDYIRINDTSDTPLIRNIYDRAKQLMLEIRENGLEASKWYATAVFVFAWSAMAIMMDEIVREIGRDQVKVVRKMAEKVLKAHVGEEGEVYVGVVWENRMMGID